MYHSRGGFHSISRRFILPAPWSPTGYAPSSTTSTTPSSKASASTTRCFPTCSAQDYSLELSQAELDLLYGFSWSGVFEWLAVNRGFHTPHTEVWRTFLRKKIEFLKGRKLRVARGFDRMLSLPVPRPLSADPRGPRSM